METEHRANSSHRLSAVRRDLGNVNDKIDIVNTKLEIINLKLQSKNPEAIAESMDSQTHRLKELEERNNIHSRRLKLLQKEIDHVHTENDILLGYVTNRESPRGFQQWKEPDNMNDRMADEMKVNNEVPQGKYDKDDRIGNPVPGSPNRGQPITLDLRQKEETNRGIASPRKTNNGPNDYRKPETGENPWEQHENRKEKPEDFDYDEFQRQRRAQIYSVYDQTAINPHHWEQKPKHRKYPWYDHETHPYPGGFLIMRFDDSGCDVCTIALKTQQSICRHAGGYLLGIARKDRIFVYESAPSKQKNWTIARKQPYKDCLLTEDALAVFWFTKKDAAAAFFENGHRNRFREPCFPTPNGYEAFYVPLLVPPTKPLNTFFCVELLDAKKYSQEDLTQFEGEVRNDMLRVYPDCLPMVVSSLAGREVFKPGTLISPYSKFYISRFEAQRQVDQIWNLGMIQALRHKWRLTGPMNVFSFSIDIAV